MVMDSWGNEYKSIEDAKKGLRKICRENEDFWEMVSEDMCIPLEVMNWICDSQTRMEDFQKHFKTDIELAIDSWCEYYEEELEVNTWVKVGNL